MENGLECAPAETGTDKSLYNRRNFWCFALGTFGRDFSYNLFVNNLLTFIMFTKQLTAAQFTCVSAIIVAARIFDAFNDPVMGGIVENTRSKFGKFRPWILIGGLTTSLVIVLLFSVPVDKWGFIAFLAVMYFAFSITFTMNDISYWALLPHLARGTHERNKLSSATQLVVGAGGGLASISIPALTTTYTGLLGGSAHSAYMWISVISAVLFMISTFVTFFGVDDKTQVIRKKSSADAPEDVPVEEHEEKLSLRDMFRVLKNNDQLLVSALIMIIFSVGTGVAGTVLTMYVYFNFGYHGMLATVLWAIGGLMTIIFLATFPALVKKIGRTRLTYIGGSFIIAGYAFTLIVGLCVPNGAPLFSLLGMDFTLRYILMTIPFGLAGLGQGCYYNMMFINMSNTVEYNDYKTGRREESLIFSLRPFTAKLSSALQQLLVMLIYLASGILSITNGISDFERQANQRLITDVQKNENVANLLRTVPESKTRVLLCCLCIIPIVFMAGAMLLYKKKFILDDETFERIKAEIAERNAAAEAEDAPDCAEPVPAASEA